MKTQVGSGLLVQATNVQNALSTTTEGNTIMNNVSVPEKITVDELAAAYHKETNLHWFSKAKQQTTRAALPNIEARVQLAKMMLDRKLDIPDWLCLEYESHSHAVAKAPVAQAAAPAKPEESVAAKVVKNTTGIACGIFKPLLTGGNVVEWTRSLAKERLVSKTDTEYSALYGAMMMANSAISGFNRRLFGAYIAGLLTQEEFMEKADAVRHRIPAAAEAIAAASRKSSTTTGSEIMEVRYRARKHNDESSDADWAEEEDFLQLQIAHLRNKIGSGHYDPAVHPEMAARLIRELQVVVTRRLEKEMRDGISDAAEWDDSDESMPRDTGVIVATVSDYEHLFSLDVADMYGIESEAIHALWHGKELSFPTNSLLEERLLEKWEAAIEWATTAEEREAATLKMTKRAISLKDGLLARMEMTNKQGDTYMGSLATYVRWTTNHVTRSLWRDIKRLELAAAEHAERLTKKEQRAMEEEENLHGDTEAVLTRARGGEAPQELGYTIKLPFIREIGEDDLPKDCTEIERARALHGTVIEEIETILPALKELYAQWRELDLAHAPIWNTFSNASMPISHPPVYWNKDGWYMTEEEAEEALFIEIAEMKQRMLDNTAETAAGYLADMLSDTFSL